MNDLSGQYGCTITNQFSSDIRQVNFQGRDIVRSHYYYNHIFSLANTQVLTYLSMEHLLWVVKYLLPVPLILGFILSIGCTMGKSCPQLKVLREN